MPGAPLVASGQYGDQKWPADVCRQRHEALSAVSGDEELSRDCLLSQGGTVTTYK